MTLDTYKLISFFLIDIKFWGSKPEVVNIKDNNIFLETKYKSHICLVAK